MTRPTDQTEPLLLDVHAVARLLGVSVRTIHRLKATGEMPAPGRLGGRVLWRRDELDAWVKADRPNRETWARIRATPILTYPMNTAGPLERNRPQGVPTTSSLYNNLPSFNAAEAEARRDATHPPTPAAPAPAAEKTWEDLEKAIRLVGAVSESAGLPDGLRGELIKALAALVWTAQSVRCPGCRCWQKKGGEQ